MTQGNSGGGHTGNTGPTVTQDAAPVKLTFYHLLGLMLIVLIPAIVLLAIGYSRTDVLIRLLAGLFVAAFLTCLAAYTINIDLKWLRATGAAAVFFAVFFSMAPKNGSDNLDQTLTPINQKLSAALRNPERGEKTFTDVASAVESARETIQRERPVIDDFQDMLRQTELWKSQLVANYTFEYRQADAERSTVALTDLLARMKSVKRFLADNPQFVLCFASTNKRVIEGGEAMSIAEVERAFGEIDELIRPLRDLPLENIGEIYRVAGNSARRVAEAEEDRTKKRAYLDRAADLMKASSTKSKRALDEILAFQSLADIYEVGGDYDQSIANIKECLNRFNNPLNAKVKQANLIVYNRAVVEYTRRLAETDATAASMREAQQLLSSPSDLDQSLVRLYIAIAHDETLPESMNQLLVANFDALNKAYFNIVRAKDASKKGDFPSATSKLRDALQWLQQHDYPREAAILEQWLVAVDQHKALSGNFFALTRFPPL
jgi:hypothetical protein